MLRDFKGRPLAWYVCSRNVETFREWCLRAPVIREDAEELVRSFRNNFHLQDEVFWIEPVREEYKHREQNRGRS